MRLGEDQVRTLRLEKLRAYERERSSGIWSLIGTLLVIWLFALLLWHMA